MMGAKRYPWSAKHREAVVRVLPAVLSEVPSIAAAYLYGSTLRDDPVGDVDLAVAQDRDAQPLMPADLGRIESRLAEACELDLPPLDLRRLTPRTSPFAHEVLRTGLLVYEASQDRRVATELALVRAYLDTKWLRDTYRHAGRDR